MPGLGIVEKVALEGRDDGEMEGGVLLANRIDMDYITVDARSGAVVIELFVDSIAV